MFESHIFDDLSRISVMINNVGLRQDFEQFPNRCYIQIGIGSCHAGSSYLRYVAANRLSIALAETTKFHQFPDNCALLLKRGARN